MNKDAQRIAIALACGWDRFCTHEVDGRIVQYGHPPQSQLRYETPLPDYLSDLNAMAEAEEVLTVSQRVDYQQIIAEISITQDNRAGEWFLVHATAAQRAEAFLRALNLWQEDAGKEGGK